jgi:Spy/CpxP family protein refolding chaperone
MRNHSPRFYFNAALAMLALALGCSPLLAQDDPQGPPFQQQGGPGSSGWQRGGPPRGNWSRGSGGPGWGGGRDADGGRWDRGGGRMGGFGMRGGRFGLSRLLGDPAVQQRVGVTAGQVTKIKQQESEFRKTAIRTRADLQVKQIDLRDLFAADKPDRAAINSKLDEISAAKLAFAKSAVDFRLNMRDALTPAQRDKLRQVMMDRPRGGGPGQASPRGPQGRGGPGAPGAANRKGPRGSASPSNSQSPAPPLAPSTN